MREFKIAVAGSRKAAWWKNTKTTWEELCGKLSVAVKTSETAFTVSDIIERYFSFDSGL